MYIKKPIFWNKKGIILRIHVGLENVDDLIQDLFKSFKL